MTMEMVMRINLQKNDIENVLPHADSKREFNEVVGALLV